MLKVKNHETGKEYELLREITPARYVWHITIIPNVPKYVDYLDFEISKHGLICTEGYVVFAHSNILNFNYLYPCFMDIWSPKYGVEDYGYKFAEYSFWRIDTSLLDFKWYVDPIMQSDFDVYFDWTLEHNPSNYVCTPNSIPNYALKNFKVDPLKYNMREPKFKYKNGVANIIAQYSDFEFLEPDTRVNAYLNKQIKFQ